MQKNTLKKILCAASIFAIAIFTAGCDDDDNNRHASRHHRHNPPPPPPHHRQHHDDYKNHRNDSYDKRRYPHREHRADMAGMYKATALNNAVTFKGSSYYIDIFEDNDKLYLTLPNGKEYPISFEGGQMTVAGGAISEQADGKFVYKDKKGGMWLVEKTQ